MPTSSPRIVNGWPPSCDDRHLGRVARPRRPLLEDQRRRPCRRAPAAGSVPRRGRAPSASSVGRQVVDLEQVAQRHASTVRGGCSAPRRSRRRRRSAAGRNAGRSSVTALTTSPASRQRRGARLLACRPSARRPAAARARARWRRRERSEPVGQPRPSRARRRVDGSSLPARRGRRRSPAVGRRRSSRDRRAEHRSDVGARPARADRHAVAERLGHVTMSGPTPKCWKPNHRPCGRARSAPRRRSAACRARRTASARRCEVAGGQALTPPSPCTGSRSTAAVDGSSARSRSSRSPNATWRKPSGSGWNSSCLAGWPVACSVASVRPWNEPKADTTTWRPGPPPTCAPA